MGFESDYKKLLSLAKVRAYNLQIGAEELISQAYINLCEKEYDFDRFKKEIVNLSHIEKNGGANIVSLDTDIKRHAKFDFVGDMCCRKCHEVKHISEFYIEVKKGGKRFIRSSCKSCIYEKQNKGNFKKFVNNNRDKWNEYNRNRSKVEKENLTDAYIRKLLRNKHTNEYILKYPFLISEYREKIIAKRLAKFKK